MKIRYLVIKRENKLLQSLGIELIHYLDKDIKRNIDRIHKDLCVRISGKG